MRCVMMDTSNYSSSWTRTHIFPLSSPFLVDWLNLIWRGSFDDLPDNIGTTFQVTFHTLKSPWISPSGKVKWLKKRDKRQYWIWHVGCCGFANQAAATLLTRERNRNDGAPSFPPVLNWNKLLNSFFSGVPARKLLLLLQNYKSTRQSRIGKCYLSEDR